MLASVFGKTVEAIEDFRSWFADRFAEHGAIVRPAEAKQRHVMDRSIEWTHREMASGHTVTSEWPPEAQAAIAKINHEAAIERQALCRSHEPTLTADRRKRRDRIDALRAELVAEVADLRDLERLDRKFAAACAERFGSGLMKIGLAGRRGPRLRRCAGSFRCVLRGRIEVDFVASEPLSKDWMADVSSRHSTRH